jgi:hypothetical protein
MTIKQPVINTFNRIGLDYKPLVDLTDKVKVSNRFSGESTWTSPLVAACIDWVYEQSNRYEQGNYTTRVSDFDRVRYFVLGEDSKAYMTCLD